METIRNKEVLKAMTSKNVKTTASEGDKASSDDDSSASSSEDLNFRGFSREEKDALGVIIAKRIGKGMRRAIQYYIDETSNKMKEQIRKEFEELKKEVGFMKGSWKDIVTYRDFTACDVPKFTGNLNLIVSRRRITAIEGNFHTSECEDKNKVNFATNFLRDSVKIWWEGKMCEKAYLGNKKLKVDRFQRMLLDDDEGVNTANGVNTTSSQVNAASLLNIDNLSDAVICAFLLHLQILRDRALTGLQRKLDLVETKKEGIQLNVNKLENASKSLNKIIECQIVDNCKKGLGYNAVPPQHTGLFPPTKSDLSYTGKGIDAPIIEDWMSDDEEEKVKTVWVKKVNTAKPKAAINVAKAKAKHKALKGKRSNAIKASTCWGYIDFGGNPKRGKITGKGKIKTEKLDFKNVYFVRELKFNLFSVSQICDKKNSVLSTDTECIALSPDFKLIDENQILLRVPRQNNMYSIDLKNIVPIGGLTCLFAKATENESKLLHKGLGI
nr:zinc finger, CCHC-type, retrotransposon Gag domain protein [Tanacetum cinerariifolium]